MIKYFLDGIYFSITTKFTFQSISPFRTLPQTTYSEPSNRITVWNIL